MITEMKENFDLTLSFARSGETVPRGDDNWFKHCGVTIRKLIKNKIMNALDALELLVEHIVDMLMFNEKVELMNYIYSLETFEEKSFPYYIKKYLDTKIVKTQRLTSMILYSNDKVQIMILKNKHWHQAEPEDEREVAIEITAKKQNDPTTVVFNNLIGFIGSDQKNRYLVFKVKDMEAKRNTGARCDEASKVKKVTILTELLGKELFDTYSILPNLRKRFNLFK
jgi:hypothetical protein